MFPSIVTEVVTLHDGVDSILSAN